jgi:hypothetical protein
VDTHERPERARKGRLKAIYDRLAAILKGLPPDRLEAFQDYVDEQAKKESNDANRHPPPAGEAD